MNEGQHGLDASYEAKHVEVHGAPVGGHGDPLHLPKVVRLVGGVDLDGEAAEGGAPPAQGKVEHVEHVEQLE